jgi:CRISPR-associated endonuclease/helicase Cas3
MVPTSSTNADYRLFWGKAGGEQAGEPSWHPVAYHCLDVAAAADALLAVSPRKLAVLARLLGTSGENARRLLVCLIALHDVGKFSWHFQAKSREAWVDGVQCLLGSHREAPPSRHDIDGYAVHERLELRRLFEPATAGWDGSDFLALWTAITGHHGQPAVEYGNRPLTDGFNRPCLEAARVFCIDARTLHGSLDPIGLPNEMNLAVLSWLVSGLTVVADWIGSNRSWFPYRSPKLSLAEYWRCARDNAANAIAEAGVMPRAVAPSAAPDRLFPTIAGALSPLQQCVLNLPLPDGPVLAIVEDVTGSGKTEAAILLAARLMQAGRADGIYFALPTMATANAMYERLSQSCERLFAEGACPSLVLAHGKRALNEAFSDSILTRALSPDGYEDDGGGAVCAAWIADDRRKAFLAHVGVGTVDQALLGVLPTRHQVLRLWGLCDRVLIIDEAHAYDAYMSREIEALLEFHAALGGSAIVLSATLPDKQRGAIEQAFARGLGEKGVAEKTSSYPLLTLISAASRTTEAVPSRADRGRTLPVRRIAARSDAVAYVEDQARSGCATAWIRNSVDDAIEAMAELEARRLAPVLLHSRFAMGDRLDIEQRIRDTLGKEDKTGGRRSFVVVGTQILEQSLDYDVDAMVTDHAPIDLIIQRAGRLWRHSDRKQRPTAGPELVVLSPDPAQVTDARWYGLVSQRAAAVYAHHGIVWRSAKVLFETRAIVTPEGVRALIDRVYGVDGYDDLPKPLLKASSDADGKRSAARSVAGAELLRVADGYGGRSQIWSSDKIVATRLGEPVTTFRLGQIKDGVIVPWYADEDTMRAWALSEVSISQRRADGVPKPDTSTGTLIKAAKDIWPKWELDMPLLVLNPDGQQWRGVAKLGLKDVPMIYDRRFGLRLAQV